MEQVKLIQNYPKANKVKIFPSFDAQKLIDEDKLNEGLGIPFRFGKGFDTKISLTDGEWIDVEGGRLWSMEFQSEGAYSINFVFNQFYLPDDAELYISNSSGTVLYGPVTSSENTKSGFFLTDLIQGDNVTIFLFEPKDKNGKSNLTIRRVVHAYKNLFPMSYGNLGGSESCNNNIACFPALDEESDAVALVLLSDGTEWCSGSLLMTAGQTFEPYFLSAFHCIDISSPYGSLTSTEISNAENWMFKFQYKMISCGGSTATMGVTYNGAEFRAAWNTSDFALMEMDNSPLGDSRFSWLGWDRSDNTPTSGTGIHHPSGDVMKISFENNQFQTSSWGETNNHWLVSFDDGVVEHGSSGSPILDQNGRVVGQLHGNQNYNENLSYCSQPRAEYGRFNNSWTGGGTNATRLSNWLDPCELGTVITNTARTPYISGPTLFCSSGTFTLSNLPPVDSIIWIPGPYLSISSGQNTSSCTFTKSPVNNGSSWVSARLVNDCGSITLPLKEVYVGGGTVENIMGPLQASTITANRYLLMTSGLSEPTSFDWFVTPSNSSVIYSYGSSADIEFNNPGDYLLSVSASNTCGSGSPYQQIITAYDSLLLRISPNPTTGETTITIKPASEKELLVSAWDLEIFTPTQALKEKKTRLKGSNTVINTAGWQEGVYVVRVLYNNEVITGKLIVKR